MNTVKEKAYAKINIYLDVLGKRGDYHLIDTIAVSINLFDLVTVTKRHDDKVVMKTSGSLYGMPKLVENDNAYKAAVLFKETFNTCGVDITVNKKIPVGGGLGGSSADASATLNAMKKLFGVKEDITFLAEKLGSDVKFQLGGGFARITGIGENVEFFDSNEKLYLLIATPKTGVTSKDCYSTYDEAPLAHYLKTGDDVKNSIVEKSLKKEDFYNALYPSAVRLNPEIERVYGLIGGLSPKAVCMSGSGSSVYGVFSAKELCEWVKDKLKNEKLSLFVTETLSKKEIDKKPLLLNPFSLK